MLYYNGSLSRALTHIFPEIGLDITQFTRFAKSIFNMIVIPMIAQLNCVAEEHSNITKIKVLHKVLFNELLIFY